MMKNNLLPRAVKHLFILMAGACLLLSLASCDAQQETEETLRKAEIAAANLDTADAVMYYELYLRKNPNGDKRWDVWLKLLDVAENYRQETNTARSYLEIMSEEYAEDAEKMRTITLRLADIATEQHDDAKAISLWELLLEDEALDAELRAKIMRKLSAAYLKRLDFTLAVETLEGCLTLNVGELTKSACLYDLAMTQALTDNLPQAEVSLRTLLALVDIPEQSKVLAIYSLADVLENQEKYKEAYELFSSILETYPNEKVVELRLVNLRPKIK